MEEDNETGKGRNKKNIAALMQAMAELLMKMNLTERAFWIRYLLDHMEQIAARKDNLAEHEQFLHDLYHLLTSRPSYTQMYPTRATRFLLN
jgi:hypothetical protein